MVQFEDLQALWQRQQPPDTRFDTEPLTQALRKYGRRQGLINGTKLVAVLSVLGWQITHTSGPASVCLVALATTLALVLFRVDWRNQRAISGLNFAEPSAGFVRSAIERLMEHREPFRKYYWPFVLGLAVMMNMILLNHPGTKTPLRRLTWHAIDSALPFAAYEFGRWLRIRRFEMECRPLVDRLKALEHALEELSE